jgi:DNA polymerase III epsilon subunit-like protein
VVATREFDRRIGASERLIGYPDGVPTGNTPACGVLKFPLEAMRHAAAEAEVLAAFFAAVDQVADPGGCLVAHNAQHDLGQLRATCAALHHAREPRPVRVLDSMTCAARILHMTRPDLGLDQNRWIGLADLARHLGVPAPPGGYHQALGDAMVLMEVMGTWPLYLVEIFTDEWMV